MFLADKLPNSTGHETSNIPNNSQATCKMMIMLILEQSYQTLELTKDALFNTVPGYAI